MEFKNDMIIIMTLINYNNLGNTGIIYLGVIGPSLLILELLTIKLCISIYTIIAISIIIISILFWILKKKKNIGIKLCY